MPYIIRIIDPPGRCAVCEDTAPPTMSHDQYERGTAVATLDEALSNASTMVCDLLAGENFGQYQDQFRAIDESGGTVGPLPDGTVIEVERVKWQTVIEGAGLVFDDFDGPVEDAIAAFNAKP